MDRLLEPPAPSLASDTTPSGLPFVGDLRWGDHFCQFYETAEDLRDCLVPFFQAGLANNEKCLWVTTAPFDVAEAAAALRAAVPNLDALIARGQIEIISHENWYLRSSDLSVGDVPKAWLARAEAALASGYAGLRLTGNAAFLEASGWHDFMHYESLVHDAFYGQRIVALCSYSIAQCGFEQALDVIRNHGFAIARRNGRWETIESASLTQTKAELARLNHELETRVAERTAELRQAEERARAHEERLRALLEALPAAIYTTDAAGRITYYNQAAVEFSGRRPKLGSDEWCVSWRLYRPDGTPLPHDQCPMAVTLKENRPVRGAEAIAERPDGTRVPFIPYPTPLRDVSGRTVGAVNMLVDITERKQAEERLMLLAREVDHRAKNMLAVIQSMVRFTRAETVPDFKFAMEGRINALAHAHSLLSASRWEGADLKQLAEEELAPYRRSEEPRVRVEGPSLTLVPAAAQSLAMALHELATNAAKYGAISVPSGRVSLQWYRCANGRVVLKWTEAGGPPVQRPTRRGFGTGVIERTIRDQLEGAVTFDWRAEGLTCTLEVPAQAVVHRAADAPDETTARRRSIG